MGYVVYVLRCRGGALYTGITTDLARRFREHSEGTAARYTRANPPKEIVYHERRKTESGAKRREAQIKSWPRRKKLALIARGREALRTA